MENGGDSQKKEMKIEEINTQRITNQYTEPNLKSSRGDRNNNFPKIFNPPNTGHNQSFSVLQPNCQLNENQLTIQTSKQSKLMKNPQKIQKKMRQPLNTEQSEKSFHYLPSKISSEYRQESENLFKINKITKRPSIIDQYFFDSYNRDKQQSSEYLQTLKQDNRQGLEQPVLNQKYLNASDSQKLQKSYSKYNNQQSPGNGQLIQNYQDEEQKHQVTIGTPSHEYRNGLAKSVIPITQSNLYKSPKNKRNLMPPIQDQLNQSKDIYHYSTMKKGKMTQPLTDQDSKHGEKVSIQEAIKLPETNKTVGSYSPLQKYFVRSNVEYLPPSFLGSLLQQMPSNQFQHSDIHHILKPRISVEQSPLYETQKPNFFESKSNHARVSVRSARNSKIQNKQTFN